MRPRNLDTSTPRHLDTLRPWCVGERLPLIDRSLAAMMPRDLDAQACRPHGPMVPGCLVNLVSGLAWSIVDLGSLVACPLGGRRHGPALVARPPGPTADLAITTTLRPWCIGEVGDVKTLSIEVAWHPGVEQPRQPSGQPRHAAELPMHDVVSLGLGDLVCWCPRSLARQVSYLCCGLEPWAAGSPGTQVGRTTWLHGAWVARFRDRQVPRFRCGKVSSRRAARGSRRLGTWGPTGQDAKLGPITTMSYRRPARWRASSGAGGSGDRRRASARIEGASRAEGEPCGAWR